MPPVLVLRAGRARRLPPGSVLVTEDGAHLHRLPADLPPGYHRLHRHSGGESTLVVLSPGLCHLPADLRGWGFAVQLYGLRSRKSWGLGDLADLRRLGAWSRGRGAAFLMTSPLGAALPTLPQEPSPYYASSRVWRNPLHLRVEEVPGAGRLGSELARLAKLGRALNHDRHLDRDQVYQLKLRALESLFAGGDLPAGFDRWQKEQGRDLELFATFCALAERHQTGWHGWPEEHQHPARPEVAHFASRHRQRVRFHAWVQWLLDRQLERVGRAVPLLNDLPVGVRPDGADAWAWQDLIARGFRVGAPPDAFQEKGQDWGLPPFDAVRLREAAYQPFIRTLRGAFRHASGLRLDHAMGLFRLWWIPPGGEATNGWYVEYPADDLLGILALESQRAGAYVVGEDLGTVEPYMRLRLRAARVLSTRVLWFEARAPSRYPKDALAAVTTHDLPTLAGAWTGDDPHLENGRLLRHQLHRLTRRPLSAPPAEVVAAAYGRLASSPARLLAVSMEDALAVRERPNLPGTAGVWPNWQLPLPVPLEELEHSPVVDAVVAAVARHR